MSVVFLQTNLDLEVLIKISPKEKLNMSMQVQTNDSPLNISLHCMQLEKKVFRFSKHKIGLCIF